MSMCDAKIAWAGGMSLCDAQILYGFGQVEGGDEQYEEGGVKEGENQEVDSDQDENCSEDEGDSSDDDNDNDSESDDEGTEVDSGVAKSVPVDPLEAITDQHYGLAPAAIYGTAVVSKDGAEKYDQLAISIKEVQLFVAAREGNMSRVVNILSTTSSAQIDLDAEFSHEDYSDNFPWTTECSALWIAASKGHAAVMQELVSAGANLESRDEIFNRSPLIQASMNGRLEAVKKLIKAGSNVHQTDRNGSTALVRAASKGHTEVVLELLQAGSRIDHKDQSGWTALMFAAHSKYLELASLLLERECQITCTNIYGETAVDLAKAQGHADLVEAIETEHFIRRRQPAYRLRASLIQLRQEKTNELIAAAQQKEQQRQTA